MGRAELSSLTSLENATSGWLGQVGICGINCPIGVLFVCLLFLSAWDKGQAKISK